MPSAELVELVSTSVIFDDAARADHRAYYSYRNEWFLRGALRPPPFIACGGELIDYDQFDRTEFCMADGREPGSNLLQKHRPCRTKSAPRYTSKAF